MTILIKKLKLMKRNRNPEDKKFILKGEAAEETNERMECQHWKTDLM